MLSTSTALAADVPMGWSVPARPYTAAVAPAFDTTPRLVRGAGKASELVQLCGVWSTDLHPTDATVEPKIDGHRCGYLGGDQGRLLSREGSAMGCAAHSLPALRQLETRYGEPMMFDGEFAVPGGLKATLAAFRRNRPAREGVFWLFDAMPLSEWERGGTDEPQANRKARLRRMVGDSGLCASVGLILDFPMDAGATEAMARGLWRAGFEGVVVKDRAAGYRRGRSNAFLKLKQGN